MDQPLAVQGLQIGGTGPVPPLQNLYFWSAIEPPAGTARLLGKGRLCFVPGLATKQKDGRMKPFLAFCKAWRRTPETDDLYQGVR
jgi:hypothetical protein